MPHSLADFYHGKRVLVTGHTGFQGGWAVAWLKVLGAQVYGYGLPPVTRPNLFDAIMLDREMTSRFSDVRDRNSLATAFSEFQPEIVLHCALRSNPHFAEREPVETYATNVMGTVNVLEEARLTPSVRALVIVTCARRDDKTSSAAAENSGVRDASMASSELAASAFHRSFLSGTGTGVASASAADAIGGGDWGEGRMLPNLVRSLTAGEPVKVADGTELAMCHVLELVHGYLLLAQKLYDGGQRYSDVWDFAPAKKYIVPATNVAKDFVKLWDSADFEEGETSPARRLGSNGANAKTRTELGWSELLSPDQAMRWTVQWYRAFYSEPSAAWRTTEDQITRFMKSALICAQA
jgi:CDP-glucose 4,6-dehydratase